MLLERFASWPEAVLSICGPLLTLPSSLQFLCTDYFFSELLQRLCQTGALPLRDLGIVGVVKKTNEIYGYEGLRQQDLKACFGTPT